MIKNYKAAQRNSQENQLQLGASKEEPECSHTCNFKLPLGMNYGPHDLFPKVYGQNGCNSQNHSQIFQL